MAARDVFPSDITESEREAGFTVMTVANPDRKYAFNSQTIEAVVYSCGPSHRVIKMRDPAGGISYKLQQYGKYDFAKDWEQPDWIQVGDTADSDPYVAVASAPGRIAESAATSHIVLAVPPSTPDSEE